MYTLGRRTYTETEFSKIEAEFAAKMDFDVDGAFIVALA